jgi:multidrug efflux pump subunit AcrA (membrane-fusion protein)
MSDNSASRGGRFGSSRPGGGRSTAGSASTPILIVLAVVIVLGGLFALGVLPRMQQSHKIAERAQDIVIETPKVEVMHPAPPLDAGLMLPGSTQAIADAQIGARTTGYIRRRYVDIGAHVHAGQVLAEIESPDVDQQLYQANAQVAQSLATVTQSRADVANRQATVAQYTSNVRQAESNLEQTRAVVADAEAKLAQLQAAEKTAEAVRDQAQATIGNKQAALRQAKTQMNLNKVTYQRYAALGEQGFAAAEDVDQNRAAYENSQAMVNSAEADLQAAQKALEGAISGVVSAQATVRSGEAEVRAAQKSVSAAAASVEAAKSTVNAARANVESGQSIVQANRYAQQANEANSKRMAVLTSFEKVVAPFDGIITARNVDVGSLINAGTGSPASSNASVTSAATLGSATAGTGLFGIARTDMLRIFVSVPQAFAPLIHAGLSTHVYLSEFPGMAFPATVARVSGALDTSSRTLLTEIHLPNRNGQVLPGMFAQVSFDLPKTTNALRVPATAVTFDAKGTRMALVTPKNQIHFVNVQQGRDFNTEVEIISGIKPDDTFVVAPTDDLVEGEEVKPVPAPPPPAPAGGAHAAH